MFCAQCGTSSNGAFCSACGTPLATQDLAPAQPASGTVAALTAGVVLFAVLLVAAVGVGAWMVFGAGADGDTSPAAAVVEPSETAADEPTEPADDPTDDGSPAAEPLSAASPSTPAVEPSAEPRAPGDVRDLPAGLFCRDLNARGYSYTAAVDYWREHGQPNQMDVERNGIPCETVYSSSDVTAYWGPRAPTNYVYDETFTSLPGGLFCRDIYAAGLDYGQAALYWNYWGRPDNMDADLNGIPCETVYPASAINAYW